MHMEHKHSQTVSKQSPFITFIRWNVAIDFDICIKVLTEFDSKTFTLHLIQSSYYTPAQPSNAKKQFFILLKTSLLENQSTNDCDGDSDNGNKTRSGDVNVPAPYLLIGKPESTDGPFEKDYYYLKKKNHLHFVVLNGNHYCQLIVIFQHHLYTTWCNR